MTTYSREYVATGSSKKQTGTCPHCGVKTFCDPDSPHAPRWGIWRGKQVLVDCCGRRITPLLEELDLVDALPGFEAEVLVDDLRLQGTNQILAQGCASVLARAALLAEANGANMAAVAEHWRQYLEAEVSCE